MKTSYWLITIPTLVLLIAAGVYDVQSNGAPMGHTNAPGELTCNRSNCHTGQPLNGGNAALTLDVGNALGYVGGAVYPVTVEIAENGKERFGFQLVALHTDDTTNAGQFIVTDSVRTKITAGVQQFAGRSYMTYRYPGTDAVAPGIGRWTFEWQAPSGNGGPVSFYAAAAAANNDGTDQGDYIYTKVLTLPEIAANSASTETSVKRLSIYPNPSDGAMTVSYTSSGKGPTRLDLVDLKTHDVHHVLEANHPAGQQTVAIDLRGKVSAGKYVLCIRQGSHVETQSLIILP